MKPAKPPRNRRAYTMLLNETIKSDRASERERDAVNEGTYIEIDFDILLPLLRK